jgi:hypothetical protein
MPHRIASEKTGHRHAVPCSFSTQKAALEVTQTPNCVADGGRMLDMSLMRSARIAPDSRRAYVEAGVTLGDTASFARAVAPENSTTDPAAGDRERNPARRVVQRRIAKFLVYPLRYRNNVARHGFLPPCKITPVAPDCLTRNPTGPCSKG